jgi:tRNA-splicing ligase RtcB
VDIACRMKLTITDLPVPQVAENDSRKCGELDRALEKGTLFGTGGKWQRPHDHPVLEEDWSITAVTREVRDRAVVQLGTSGSGNHFVEFGVLTLDKADLGLAAGTYLALLSHSGSRGTGNLIATHYSKLAMQLHPELPRELQHLAWLDLDTHVGQEYWQAMELMGRYAAANHALVHEHVTRNLGAEVMLDIENHHNFAWKETHFGRDLIVHRKGATPAQAGVIGIIPGSMATPGFVIRGKGKPESLHSASHGAGRRMSRKAAKRQFTLADSRAFLKERGVTLISAGLDEVPMAYKDILSVMKAQQDLVEPIARFDPKLVKMAPPGERPED